MDTTEAPPGVDPIGFAMTVRGQRHEVIGTSVDAEDEYAFEMETGRALQDFLSGELNQARLAVMWWLARRHAGETRLKVETCVTQFPKPLEVAGAKAVDGDDQTVFQLEELYPDEATSPEASGGSSDPTGLTSPASTASTPGTSADLSGSPEPS